MLHVLSLHLVSFFLGEYSPHSGQFSGENIRLGSRGDSYYEYLIKIWIQQKNRRDTDLKYLHEMYTEAMRGVRHRLVKKSVPKGLVFVGELPYGPQGGFSPKMDHLVCNYVSILLVFCFIEALSALSKGQYLCTLKIAAIAPLIHFSY